MKPNEDPREERRPRRGPPRRHVAVLRPPKDEAIHGAPEVRDLPADDGEEKRWPSR